MTSGARKKIILSIYRLVKRPDTLAEIEQVRMKLYFHIIIHVYNNEKH